MTERLASLTDEQWNQAEDLNMAAEKVRTAVGHVPR